MSDQVDFASTPDVPRAVGLITYMRTVVARPDEASALADVLGDLLRGLGDLTPEATRLLLGLLIAFDQLAGAYERLSPEASVADVLQALTLADARGDG